MTCSPCKRPCVQKWLTASDRRKSGMGSYTNVCLWRFSQGGTDSSCLPPGFECFPWRINGIDIFTSIVSYKKSTVYIKINHSLGKYTIHWSYGAGIRNSEKWIIAGVYCIFAKKSIHLLFRVWFVCLRTWKSTPVSLLFLTSTCDVNQRWNQHQKADGISWVNPALLTTLQISFCFMNLQVFSKQFSR